ncbi:MAG: hypothetical protein BAJALOKI1v1_1050016 [Promethearchaeota archaeon]|nr:MAG: hypothetical protein BAJALOKI1v1_1050016 [Candidatus Lokiarchaeota archaeon]
MHIYPLNFGILIFTQFIVLNKMGIHKISKNSIINLPRRSKNKRSTLQ